MKKIPFYGHVNSFSVKEFIKELSEAEENETGAHMIVSSSGGDPIPGWGLIVEWRNFTGEKKYTVHGEASSTMAYNALFVENSECIQQSKFVLHRASAFFENEQIMPFLKSVNEDLRKAVEEKLDIAKFEKLAGVTVERFFDSEQPAIDLTLNAKQAKSIGLIKKVLTLSANEVEATNKSLIAACNGVGATLLKTDEKKTIQKDEKMDKKEFQAKHPDLYAQAVSEGKSQSEDGILKAEQERVKAWNVWAEVDPKSVKEGIESGEAISASQSQEFMLKASKQNLGEGMESDSQESLETEQADGLDEKGKKVVAFKEALGKKMKIELK